MLLVYIDKMTNRVGYTLNLIFKDVLGLNYSITTNKENFIKSEGAKLSYTKHQLKDEFFICSTDLLFETIIENKDINISFYNKVPIFFRTFSRKASIPFDIFAATFYMVSRYEEYLPFVQDKYGRFSHQESLAFKNCFLSKPVVNIWADILKKELLEKFPSLEFPPYYFRYYNTIDIDSAYSFKCKGLSRKLWGMSKDLFSGRFNECLYRFQVCFNKKKDPFDTFDYQVSLINKYKIKTIFFVLFGHYGKYDKNISSYNKKFQRLIKNLCDYGKMGIHPSYSSFEDEQELSSQIKHLTEVIHKPITRSRYHYLKFRLPISYRRLLNNMITDEYSMGYSNTVGFRSGICSGYNFYDLAIDGETKLRLHPFNIMDVALKNGLGLNPEEALERIKQIIDEIVKVNGDFISVWHNESLSNQYEWEGWKEVYEKMVEYASNIERKVFK
ncbi:MAG: polysaccharide deacetylase family protein [Bacteroidales bacterium]|jgi:hypothetical protein|nr:polysaccharide deacetylase family protein [Bacteroidales bacterium]